MKVRRIENFYIKCKICHQFYFGLFLLKNHYHIEHKRWPEYDDSDLIRYRQTEEESRQETLKQFRVKQEVEDFELVRCEYCFGIMGFTDISNHIYQDHNAPKIPDLTDSIVRITWIKNSIESEHSTENVTEHLTHKNYSNNSIELITLDDSTEDPTETIQVETEHLTEQIVFDDSIESQKMFRKSTRFKNKKQKTKNKSKAQLEIENPTSDQTATIENSTVCPTENPTDDQTATIENSTENLTENSTENSTENLTENQTASIENPIERQENKCCICPDNSYFENIEGHIQTFHSELFENLNCQDCKVLRKKDLSEHKKTDHFCVMCSGFIGPAWKLERHIFKAHREIFQSKKRKQKDNLQSGLAKIQKLEQEQDFQSGNLELGQVEPRPEENLQSGTFLSDLQIQVKQVVAALCLLRGDHSDLTVKMAFQQKIARAKLEEENATILDRKKGDILRLGGYAWDHHEGIENITDIQERVKFGGSRIIESLCFGTFFNIASAKIYHPLKKVDVIELRFSDTDVPKLFHAFKDALVDNSNMFVERLVSPATRVRFFILELVRNQLRWRFPDVKFEVRYVEVKPFLCIYERGKEKEEAKFDFGDAVFKFINLLEKKDLGKIKKMCGMYGLVRRQLDQFIVDLS